MATTNSTRRRFVRFSLRALLLLVLAGGVALGWTLHKVREQGRAIAALEALGCSLHYAQYEPLTLVERARMLLGDPQPRSVVGVDASNLPMTDSDLIHLESLVQVRILHLDRTDVTDAGLIHLDRLDQLRCLFLAGTRVTLAGVARLHERQPMVKTSRYGCLPISSTP